MKHVGIEISETLTFTFETTDKGDFVVNLGTGEVARFEAALMVALFAGHTVVKDDGSHLYFNGDCDEDGYRELYDCMDMPDFLFCGDN